MASFREKRQGKRSIFTVTVEYSYLCRDEGTPYLKTGAAVTSNLSEAGIGIFTNQMFGAGQNLTIYSKNLNDSPLATEVRWCRKFSANMYKVGLMFA